MRSDMAGGTTARQPWLCALLGHQQICVFQARADDDANGDQNSNKHTSVRWICCSFCTHVRQSLAQW